MKNQKGFSLIELLIVVVIIGIVAAIAIPNLLASRLAANESSAISTLRTYHSAQITFQATTGGGSFAGNMSGGNAFPVLAAAGILDNSLSGSGGSVTKSGYLMAGYATAPSATQPATFIGGATPLVSTGISATGSRDFLIATPGVIHYDTPGGGMGWDNSGAPITITGGNVLNN